MNIENINKTIAIMERAKERDSVYMPYFQKPAANAVCVYTETEFHTCGNKACLAGHIAVSPEWLSEDGHGIGILSGSPTIGAEGGPIEDYFWGSDAIAKWWEVSVNLAAALTTLTTATEDDGDYVHIVYGVQWESATAEHVIREITLLRDLGEEEYCKLKGI